MALATYSDLIAALSVFLDGQPLAGMESVIIATAEAEINARLADAVNNGAQIRPMVTFGAITISAEYVTLPDAAYSMVLPISLEVTGLNRPWRVSYTAPDNLVDLKYDQDCARSEIYAEELSNPPRHYTVVGESFRFFPAPEDSFTAEFTRYAKLSGLSESNTTNWLLTNHPNVYLYGALAQAELMGWNDERAGSVYAPLFENALGGVIASYPSLSDSRPLRSDVPAGMGCGLPC